MAKFRLSRHSPLVQAENVLRMKQTLALIGSVHFMSKIDHKVLVLFYETLSRISIKKGLK